MTLIFGDRAGFISTNLFESLFYSSFCNVTFVLVLNCFMMACLYSISLPDTLNRQRLLSAVPTVLCMTCTLCVVTGSSLVFLSTVFLQTVVKWPTWLHFWHLEVKALQTVFLIDGVALPLCSS